jgi:alkanesulfonate monooxygenase SsuD/methylene tetrahydromethanopterin reductase-like flavin-dependent oxidoreductase (luciferase family)
MKVGVYDHLDFRDVPLQQYYAERLRLIELYDRLGFYAYHLAEHHCTPLGLAPSPSVFLSAVAQCTKRLRFGPLVYTLPLHHPLRLAEEICMLDQMSGGRLQVGIGRGISPIESTFYGTDPAQSQAIYIESFAVLKQALTRDLVSHQGEHYSFDKVPIVLRPLQRPHPPIWYGVGHPEGVDWCVANDVNAVINGPVARVREISDRYRRKWAESGKPVGAMPLIGTNRHIVVAESDARGLALAERAYARWFDSYTHLARKHGAAQQFALFPQDFGLARQAGLVVAGSPETVLAELVDQVRQVGVSYLLARLAFGDLSFAESATSTELFATRVMPGLIELEAVTA